MFKSLIQRLGVVVAVGFLAACGGGGGGDSCNPLLSSCGSSSTGGGTTTSEPKVSISIVDSAGNATTNVAIGSPARVRATVKKADGSAAGNVLVSFSTNEAVGVLTPSTGSVLTNSVGLAEVGLEASGITAEGAASVEAVATVSGTDVTGSAVYQVGAPTLSLSALTLSTGSIPAYGTSTASVTVNVNGTPTLSPLTVSFSSGCAASGKATLSSSVQTINGIATATYTDNGCAGRDTITAQVLGKSVNTAVTVAAPKAANIQFETASPELIAIKGTAGLPTVSVVTFKVVDTSGNPLASQKVFLDLTTGTGGIKLDGNEKGSAALNLQKETAADGTVSVSVEAGTNPTSVWVTARLDGSTLSTQSNKLVITTGLPTQDRFSLAAAAHNINGWRHDGVTSALTVYAFDRVGNPVPDGSTVNFITEGAGVVPGSCQTENGRCTVQFTSGESRPLADSIPENSDADPTNDVTKGRVTVLAYMNGEESFDDSNGNNTFEASTEVFRDLGDVFVDNDENGIYGAPEQTVPFGNSTGAACSTPLGYETARSVANTCNGVWGQSQVRRLTVMTLSSSYVGTLTPTALTVPAASCEATLRVRLADENNNPMPATTTLQAASFVKYAKSGETELQTATVTVLDDTVGDTTAPGGTFHSIRVRGEDCVVGSTFTGLFDLKIVAPTRTTTYSISVDR